MTDKNAKISQMILSKMEAGLSVKEAIDAVLGNGTSDKLISDLHDKLRTN